VQLTDDQGHTSVGVLNVHIDELPPDVSAGTDLTVNAGQPVTFAGSAQDYSGIATVEWDFNYDGADFVADPSAEGTLTPMHTFLEPGTYDVALRVVDNYGSDNLDVITVTVNDVAPAGSAALSALAPGGAAYAPTAGAPAYFAVRGLSYTDPAATPSVWVDWGDGSGNFDLVTEDQW
jgi:PKD repeat protein